MATCTADDPEDDAVTWSLSGVDEDVFEIFCSGAGRQRCGNPESRRVELLVTRTGFGSNRATQNRTPASTKATRAGASTDRAWRDSAALSRPSICHRPRLSPYVRVRRGTRVRSSVAAWSLRNPTAWAEHGSRRWSSCASFSFTPSSVAKFTKRLCNLVPRR